LREPGVGKLEEEDGTWAASACSRETVTGKHRYSGPARDRHPDRSVVLVSVAHSDSTPGAAVALSRNPIGEAAIVVTVLRVAGNPDRVVVLAAAAAAAAGIGAKAPVVRPTRSVAALDDRRWASARPWAVVEEAI
jgi:hypothetical protein